MFIGYGIKANVVVAKWVIKDKSSIKEEDYDKIEECKSEKELEGIEIFPILTAEENDRKEEVEVNNVIYARMKADAKQILISEGILEEKNGKLKIKKK